MRVTRYVGKLVFTQKDSDDGTSGETTVSVERLSRDEALGLAGVIRCRDCKNCEMDYTDGVMFGETVCWAWDNGHDYPHFTSPDGFCYQGERRDDE